MLRRTKPKRIVDMTNEEAAAFYVRRAQSAALNGDSARANHLYQTAALHDPDNQDARRGIEQTDGAPPRAAVRSGRSRRALAYRSRRRPWWKRVFGVA